MFTNLLNISKFLPQKRCKTKLHQFSKFVLIVIEIEMCYKIGRISTRDFTVLDFGRL